MSQTEIQQLARAISDSGATSVPWWAFLLVIVVAAAGGYFGAYLREKGKNVATKEDVRDITDKIESVRLEYAQKIEALKGNYQLRAVALEQRLATHQKAYALWRKLLSHVHDKKIHEVASECQEWWTNNCLYLTSEARDSFRRAIIAANDHRFYLEGRLEADKIKENFALIEKAGDKIVAGADLPPLPDEAAPLNPKDDSKDKV